MKYHLYWLFFIVALLATSQKTFGDDSESHTQKGKKLDLNKLLNENQEDSQKERRIKIILSNDNFGSTGNESGFSHGSRIVYSQGPTKGKNFSISLGSQVYIEDNIVLVTKDDRAIVYAVEQNNIEVKKRIPISNSEYIILGGLAGYTTSRSKHFLPIGAQNQQDIFHRVFNTWSDDVLDYEYNQDWCHRLLDQVYDNTYSAFPEIEQDFKEGCSVGDPSVLTELQNRGFDCENIPLFINTILEDFEIQFEGAKNRCNGKTKAHAGLKFAFGKIYRLDKSRSICHKSKNPNLSCVLYFQLEGGLDLNTIKNDSAFYLSAEINQPLFAFKKNSILSASARLGLRHQIFEGKSEQNKSLGFQWSLQNSSFRLEIVQPSNSTGRLFDILNDDDSLVRVSYEFSF